MNEEIERLLRAAESATTQLYLTAQCRTEEIAATHDRARVEATAMLDRTIRQLEHVRSMLTPH